MKAILIVFVYMHIDYQVVINLHHEGVLMSSRETKAGSCTVWNTSFLFDLPPGDISHLPLMLEFIIAQVKTSTERIFISSLIIIYHSINSSIFPA